LPAIIHKIHLAKVNDDSTVEIWGDGKARREFMYAGDLADAVMKAAANIDTLPDLMNCGVGQDHTIRTYYETVADVIGWYGDFTYDLSRFVGMKQKLCATDRQSEWGWSAATSLPDGIKATYEFYLNEVIK
jgi:GDP-L-fucose synthase